MVALANTKSARRTAAPLLSPDDNKRLRNETELCWIAGQAHSGCRRYVYTVEVLTDESLLFSVDQSVNRQGTFEEVIAAINQREAATKAGQKRK